MLKKRIIAIGLGLALTFGMSVVALAGEPTIDFGGMEFTRAEFIEMFPDGGMVGRDMVSAEEFFDFFLNAQNNGLVQTTPSQSPPTSQGDVVGAVAEAYADAEDREVVAVVFDESVLLTSDELLSLIETAPTHHDTRSATPLPNRRITDTELEAWVYEYIALGGINAFELGVVLAINEVRAEHGLHPLAICPHISMAARFHSQEMADLRYFAHQSPHHGGSTARMRMFGNDRGLAENAHANTGDTISPQRVVEDWMNSAGHRRLILNSSARYIGIGVIRCADHWNGIGRTTAKFGF